MIIGICGFSWSGSGALLDYLMEFQSAQVYTPEFIIAYHPDGIRDLDANLNEHCAKFLSSGVAIPRFRNIMNSLLSEPTRGQNKQIVEKYINQLIQAKWIGLEQGQELLRNKWLYRKIGLRIRNKIISRLPMEFCWKYKPYPLKEMEFSICPYEFEKKTHEFMINILGAVGLDTNKDIVLNQPFPGNNPVPYMRYFPNSKAIIVDRDPRDVYVFLKNVFPGHSYSVPLQDVNVFCSYFENMHKNISETLNNPDVLYIHFEDLIYHYDETTNQICSFLGYNTKKQNRKYFIPEESAANTQVFKRYGNRDEIKIIEEKLEKYIYDFSRVSIINHNGYVFDDNPKSEHYFFKR